MIKPRTIAIVVVSAIFLLAWFLPPNPADPHAPSVSGTTGMLLEENDEALRQKLHARINRNGDISDTATPNPQVTLAEFFEGNNDPGSIGYNLNEQVSLAEFYSMFKTIRHRPDVSDVRVQVKDHEDLTGWPSTDTVWIITGAAFGDVASWIPDRFRPSEYLDGFLTQWPIEAYEIPAGMRAVGVWWD